MNDKSQRRASFLIRFGYIGSAFHGLQPSPGLATAGGALHELLAKAAGVPPKALQFSARTDAGVHALENYASCWFQRPFDVALFRQRLKTTSHPLLFAEPIIVHYKVHARANAQGKWYRYVIEDDSAEDREWAWCVVPKLDDGAMQIAAKHLVGTHEFDAFRHGGCTQSSTSKTLTELSVTRVGGQIHIDIRGTAFLRRMVRIIVGTLAEVGAGFRKAEDMSEILQSKQRRQAGPSAPACGLMLMRVGMEL